MRGTMLLASGLGLVLVVLAAGCAPHEAQREALVTAQLAGEPPREQILQAREIIAGTRSRPAAAVLAVRLANSLCGRVIGEDKLTGLPIIDLGARDGLREGDPLLLFQYAHFIGKGIVVHVFPEQAAIRTGVAALETRQEPPPQASAPTEGDRSRGRVVGVDRRLGVILFDLGEPLGVKKGEEVIVARGDSFIASAHVFDVQLDRSAARLDPGAKDPPLVGDVVMRKRGTR